MFIFPTSGIRAHGVVGQRWLGYRGSFCSWSGNGVCVLKALSQMEWGQYIAPTKPIKPTQTILEKGQQRSIIANHARQ